MTEHLMENEDPAWLQFRAMFADVYDASNYVSPMQSALMRASHRGVEKAFGKNQRFPKVLEIGAGTGEHLAYVRHDFDQYVVTDLDEKTLEIASGKIGAKFGDRVSFESQKGEELSYANDSFDRLIAAHVLEHIYKPHLVIKEWRRVLKNGGVLSILIPTDPGVAWRLGRHLGPRKHALAKGIAYDYVMAREHVNSCNNLIALLRHYFYIRTESWWPFRIPSIDLNLFFICHAVIKK